MRRYLIVGLTLLGLAAASPVTAQSANVLATCGTLPTQWSLSAGQTGRPLYINTDGELCTVGGGGAGSSVDITAVGGNAVTTTLPVADSSVVTAINNAAAASIPAGSAVIGAVSLAAAVGNGTTQHHLVLANSTNATVVKAGAGVIYSIQTGGISASAPAYLKLYDKSTTPTCNSDTIVKTIIIPANSLGGGNNVSFPVGAGFTAGISYCVTGALADNDNTAVAAATFTVNMGYK